MLKKISALGIAAALSTPYVFADQNKPVEEFSSHYYVGFILGSSDVKSNSGAQDFNFITGGFVFGRQVTQYLGVEGFINFPISEERDEFVSEALGQDADAEHSSWGVMGTARTPGQLYAKAKAGLVSSNFNYTSQGFEDESESTYGLAYSLGVGVQVKNVSFELDYLVLPETDDPIFPDESYDPSSFQATLNFAY